ncbi:hypothetical protein RE6C_04812 [Rhodopirellula europaea 6C]|uniref:Uncharacterized protein n=1 Tax=Rhodopirellula europaea 6C TaxID=1263867 RepID=M2AC43_9BACT|nr:hypothetical protein RE6C_04812 [Rhodopirellula europaea 6C]
MNHGQAYTDVRVMQLSHLPTLNLTSMSSINSAGWFIPIRLFLVFN